MDDGTSLTLTPGVTFYAITAHQHRLSCERRKKAFVRLATERKTTRARVRNVPPLFYRDGLARVNLNAIKLKQSGVTAKQGGGTPPYPPTRNLCSALGIYPIPDQVPVRYL